MRIQRNKLKDLRNNMNFFLALLLLLITAIISCSKDGDSSGPISVEEIVRADASLIDVNNEQQVIRGFGAATVFRLDTPLNNTDQDLLFGNANGQIGLSILRIRVASDDDASSRAIELKHALGAKAHGAIVIATPWSPPVRMKTNNNLIGGALKTTSYAEYATYLNDFSKYMKNNNASLYAISVQNEPDYVVTYESCDWTPTQMTDFLKNNGATISDTKVIAGESFNFNHNLTDPILNDATAATNVSIIGGHIYGGGLADYPLAKSKGKEVWMTEHLDTNITWDNNFATGKEIHDCLTTGNFNAYITWYAKRFYGPLGEDGVVTKRGYIMSNFSKFIRPGYVRIGATEKPKSDIFISAYKGNGKTVIVAINTGSSILNQQFAFKKATITSVTPYITSENMNLEKKTDVNVNASIGAFSYSLPAKSITTFVSN
jgi:glucuronoarabinoxylan endo-1,4-beta-xylanase